MIVIFFDLFVNVLFFLFFVEGGGIEIGRDKKKNKGHAKQNSRRGKGLQKKKKQKEEKSAFNLHQNAK
jgi:hypothetical protein